MKYTYKKALIACALTSVFSMHALAQEPSAAVASSMQPAQANIVAEEESPASLYSNLNAEQAAEISKSKAVTRSLDELNRRKDKSSLELELIKLEVEKEKSREEIRKLKGEATSAEAAKASSEGAEQANEESSQKAKRNDSTSPLDRVFVTQIYGLEGNEIATVFYENSIIKARSGDAISDGLRLDKVLPNGAVFSYKGATKKALLTTKEQAFSRSFSSSNDRDDGDQYRQQAPRMAMPMTPTPGN